MQKFIVDVLLTGLKQHMSEHSCFAYSVEEKRSIKFRKTGASVKLYFWGMIII